MENQGRNKVSFEEKPQISLQEVKEGIWPYRRLIGLILVVIIGWLLVGKSEEQRTTAASPGALARYHFSDAKTKLEGGKLNVEYEMRDILTVGIATSSFYRKLKDFVPELFDRFAEVDQVSITAMATFDTVRGGSLRDRAIEVVFSRSNAKTINWSNVRNDNIPKIADRYWAEKNFRN